MPKKDEKKNTQDVSTTSLMNMLETSPNLFRETQLSGEKDKITFHKYLLGLMSERNVDVSGLISGCCISNTYAYQFVKGERLPGRNIVLRMAFFLGLDVADTQRLLTLAGKNILYPKVRRDASILFCMKKKMTLDETNFFLTDLGEESLL